MNFLIALLILGFILIIIGVFFGSKERGLYSPYSEEPRPYLSKSPLTPTEILFYHRLKEALPEFIVLAQVQLSSFIKVDTSKSGRETHNKWFNPISQQSVDFLICDNDFSIITAIELDDKSHVGAKSIERDNKKNENLDAANVPLIRWHVEAMPETETIKQVVFKFAPKVSETVPKEPEWLIGEPPNFLRRQQNPIKSIVVNVIIWFAIAMIAMTFLNLANGFLKNLTVNKLHKPQLLINQELQNNNINQPELLFEKQRREQELREAARVEEDQARLEIIRQQNKEKLQRAHEAALKQEAWERYSKKSVECITRDDMVTCGNTYIRDKAKLEKYWEAQQRSLKY